MLDVKNNRMPSQKETILFANIDGYLNGPKLLFFKPENAGVNTYFDQVRHLADFVYTQTLKCLYHDADTQPGMQKEHLSYDVSNAARKLYDYFEEHKYFYLPDFSKIKDSKC